MCTQSLQNIRYRTLARGSCYHRGGADPQGGRFALGSTVTDVPLSAPPSFRRYVHLLLYDTDPLFGMQVYLLLWGYFGWYAHGEKLDLFLQKVCSSKFILICDDDIFWLDQSPIAWALDKLKEDPKTVVVSLMPRGHSSELMQEKVGRPMGSYCLVINRELWLKENLSSLYL